MFIFSEDPPLKYKGHGLSVLLYNLFHSSNVKISKWFTFLSGGNIFAEDILTDADLNLEIIDVTPAFGFLRKSAKFNLIYNQFLFLLFLPYFVYELRKHPKQPLFIPIGASAYILYKICLLKLVTRNPIWVYIVDDLKEISESQKQTINKILCKLFLKRSLQSSHKIFAITDKLAGIISEAYEVNVKVILPCFQKIAPITRDSGEKTHRREFTFVFTGGLNFLYNDALKTFSSYLNRLQQEGSIEFRLIVQTYSNKKDFDKIAFEATNVEYRTSENRSDLYKTYQEADAFIVPYSFDHANYTMISTSFPQKIAQIIQFQVPIVVFGPSYGSVVEFFKKEELNYIIDQDDFDAFKLTILKLLEHHKDLKIVQDYIKVYQQNFSQQACLQKLIKV